MNDNKVELSNGALIGGAVIALLIVLAILFFIFSFRTVDAGQVGIVRRFGEVNRVQESGIAIKAPFPVERMTKMDIRIQKEELTATAATKDQQDVNVKLALNYQIKNENALRVFKELNNDYKERVIIPSLQESFKATTAGYTAQELTNKRPEVKAEALKSVKEKLSKYGISVVDLNIVDLTFSAKYNEAIEGVQIANQQVLKAQQDLERVKVEAQRDIEKAQGDAEAQRLQQETLTSELLQKQAIEKWNGQLPTTVSGDSGAIFSIPLR